MMMASWPLLTADGLRCRRSSTSTAARLFQFSRFAVEVSCLDGDLKGSKGCCRAQAAQKEVIETERRERRRLEEAQAAQQQLMEKMMSQMLAQQEALNALMSKSGSAPTPP